MNYNFIPTDLFKREFKRLAKRYNSLKQDLIDLYSEMQAPLNLEQTWVMEFVKFE